MAKQVAKTAETAVTKYDYGQDAGVGFDNQTSDDYAVPFLAVLQPLSPQCMETDAAKNGAVPGGLMNTASGVIYGGQDGVPFVPCATVHHYVEWLPREEGGGGGAGFVAIHALNSEEVMLAKDKAESFGKYFTGTGNILAETFYIFGYIPMKDGVPDPEGTDTDPMCIAFASTKIKPYKNIMYRIRTFKKTIPMYAHRLRIKTVKQENKKGQFFNFEIAPLNGDVPKSLIRPGSLLLDIGREIEESVRLGTARVAYENQGMAADGDSAANVGDGGDAKNVPF